MMRGKATTCRRFPQLSRMTNRSLNAILIFLASHKIAVEGFFYSLVVHMAHDRRMMRRISAACRRCIKNSEPKLECDLNFPSVCQRRQKDSSTLWSYIWHMTEERCGEYPQHAGEISRSESELECDPNFPNIRQLFVLTALTAPSDRKRSNSPLSGSNVAHDRRIM